MPLVPCKMSEKAKCCNKPCKEQQKVDDSDKIVFMDDDHNKPGPDEKTKNDVSVDNRNLIDPGTNAGYGTDINGETVQVFS